MKFSIITVVYNNVNYIEDCLKSVISQSYGDIEYIVIDGRSTDGTLEVIDRYRESIAKIVSEKDSGYADGLNSGLRLATGDIVGFLHSDDFYAHERVVEILAAAFEDASIDSMYGDLVYVKRENPQEVVRYWTGGAYDYNKIKWGWAPPHPTFFVKREVYERYGYFDTGFKIAADYEIMLRLLYKFKISAHYIPQVLVKMRMGGMSNRNFKALVRRSVEDYRACKSYGVKRKLSTIMLKKIAKIPQFFAR